METALAINEPQHNAKNELERALPNPTREEQELWLGKREFLIKKLNFSQAEAEQGATTVVRAFREFFAA